MRGIPGAGALSGRRIAVVGLGKSGRACLAALSELTEATLSAWDSSPTALEDLPRTRAQEIGHDADAGILAARVMAWRPDVVVPAPAIPEVGPLFQEASRRGVPLWSEIELAWRMRAFDGERAAPWLCVTGTNGKTTTVAMTAGMLRAAGLRGEAIGNIGTPAVTAVSRTDENAPGAFAIELSSFQLRTTHSMSPHASVCLNVADDHLEWHGSERAYRDAKARIYERTAVACVYPVSAPAVQRMVDGADVVEGARAIGVTLGAPLRGQIGLVGDVVVDRAYGAHPDREGIELFELADLAHLAPDGSDLPAHVVWDALAASALSRAVGVRPEFVRQGLRGFSGGPHRIELVARVGGVRYVDDSKATNAHAARASLGAQADASVVWIVGGLAKGARFDDLVAAVEGKLRGVVVIGVDQEPWRRALDGLDGVPASYVDPASESVMDEAVSRARELARPGDTVLLAPACASMDQFASYAERGEAFAAAARSCDG